ncbi:VanZ family protein [Streptomyces ipomoeae]|uniref:VanZ-like protein n=1 Tax=Streptomyces ipomoeae 91-03 TaxID=698759 RepID=L1L1V0_9ACTN|nr:VanZ family protein [Streptomyces ipomoeae]EKX66857.1 VanZ-like protein [Streptomyces ipomoeae 91-03]MDX2694260.1 VanZ family protein [Streptomyces ipomoeae]MDX2839577.1 VanZ family protein [Streptomyces ipomoeae]TQE19660.1 VanZ family protein [Streptomyces ipomoeae]
MIEASISAVPGLVVTFLVLGTLFGFLTAFLAKSRNRPWQFPTALAIYVAGILSVTLLPGDAGLEAAQCDAGAPVHLFTDTSSLLNIALFAPGAFLAVLALRRPVTVAAAFVCLSGTVELIQATGYLGRSCSLTDVTANATGSVLGACAGAIWCYSRRMPTHRAMRDALWGFGLLLVGATAFAAFFHARIESVDIVALDDSIKARVNAADEADAWLAKAATATFGEGTEIESSTVEKVGTRTKVTAVTNRGEIVGWWPDKQLETAWATNNKGDDGRASKQSATAAADRFAQTWFPDSVKGSERNVRTLGEGTGRAYLVSYRRYNKDDVLMPMRLDITITTKKRIIGFTARTLPDPQLTSVTVDEGKARELAHEASGKATQSTLLLAQQVDGVWRPVWLVGAGNKDVAIDAATGQRISTDK